MLNVSKAVRTAIKGEGRTFTAKIVCGKNEVTEGIQSITTEAQTSENGYAMGIGTSCATTSTITMVAGANISFTGNEFELWLGIAGEYMKMGLFTAQKPKKENNTITITAFDRMAGVKFNKPYVSMLNYPCDISKVCEEIQTFTGYSFVEIPTGITLHQVVKSDDGSTVEYMNPFDGKSFRDTVGLLAGLLGKIATFTRDGLIEFRGYKAVNCKIDDNMTYSDVSLSEEPFSVGYVSCNVDATKTLQKGEGKTGLSFSNYLMTDEILGGIYNSLKDFSYHESSFSFKGDCTLDVGDIVTLETLGKTYAIPIMKLYHDYDGGLTTQIACYGSTEQAEANYQSPTQKAISSIVQELAVLNNLIVNKTITIGDIKGLEIGGSNLINGSKTMEVYGVGVYLCDENGVALCDENGNQLFTTDRKEKE